MQTTISKFPEFIGLFDDAVPVFLCDELITKFEQLHDIGFSVNRQAHDQVDKLTKNDDSVFGTLNMDFFGHVQKSVLDCIWENAYKHYAEVFSVLNNMQKHTITELKIQRTLIGGGYHGWHFEADGPIFSRRLLAYTIYLNDVEEGGETEFLYYPRRVKPKKGTILLFPAGYTHTHRGNPPISNTKYIATGWIEF